MDFRKLRVWRKAYDLALAVYRATKQFPREEIYGLTSQMRRAGVSIAANISEGCCRNGSADFARFLQIALGSASELECLILLSKDLGLPAENLIDETTDVKRMLTGLIQTLRAENGRRIKGS